MQKVCLDCCHPNHALSASQAVVVPHHVHELENHAVDKVPGNMLELDVASAHV